MQKLVLNLFESFGADERARVQIVRDAGFDGFFSAWGGKSDTLKLADAARDLGVDFQSVHAPFGNARKFWHGTEEEAAAIQELIDAARREE